MSQQYRVVIGRSATADLDAIAAYITDQGDPDAALRLIDALTERIEMLEHFPLRGSEPKELRGGNRKGYRQLVHGRYRLFYQVRGDQVAVVLVADGRRDMEALLAARLLAP